MSNAISTDCREFVGKNIVIVEACYNVADSFIPTDGRNIHVGAACARLFSERGANVTILDPSATVLEELKERYANVVKQLNELSNTRIKIEGAIDVLQQIEDSKEEEAQAATKSDSDVGEESIVDLSLIHI